MELDANSKMFYVKYMNCDDTLPMFIMESLILNKTDDVHSARNNFMSTLPKEARVIVLAVYDETRLDPDNLPKDMQDWYNGFDPFLDEKNIPPDSTSDLESDGRVSVFDIEGNFLGYIDKSDPYHEIHGDDEDDEDDDNAGEEWKKLLN